VDLAQRSWLGGVPSHSPVRSPARCWHGSGKKFDMRLYCLVTSFSPLVVWMYRSGFARFSNARYSNDSKQMQNLRTSVPAFVARCSPLTWCVASTDMHLTNVAIQKTAENYNKAQGCKWSLRRVKMYMVGLLRCSCCCLVASAAAAVDLWCLVIAAISAWAKGSGPVVCRHTSHDPSILVVCSKGDHPGQALI